MICNRVKHCFIKKLFKIQRLYLSPLTKTKSVLILITKFCNENSTQLDKKLLNIKTNNTHHFVNHHKCALCEGRVRSWTRTATRRILTDCNRCVKNEWVVEKIYTSTSVCKKLYENYRTLLFLKQKFNRFKCYD